MTLRSLGFRIFKAGAPACCRLKMLGPRKPATCRHSSLSAFRTGGAILRRLFCLIPLWACCASLAQEVLPNTQPLLLQGDISTQMVAGIDKFLTRELDHSIAERPQHWQRDFSSIAAYETSVQTNRERLRKIIGAVDERLRVTALELVATAAMPTTVAETDSFTVQAVRWPVVEGVFGEGLFLYPTNLPRNSRSE